MTNQSCGAGLIGVGGEADAFGAARVRNDADEHPFGGDSRVVRDVNEDGFGVQEGGLKKFLFLFILLFVKRGQPSIKMHTDRATTS